MPPFQLFPFPFWLVLAAIVFFAFRAWQQPESALRLPMLAILATVTTWYVGDALYNDYSDYLLEMDATSLSNAWWEVLGFLCAFMYLAPLIHRHFNRKYLGQPSHILSLIKYGGLKDDRLQSQFDIFGRISLGVWAALMLIALIRTDFDFQGLFMPYLGEKAEPWGRGRVGAGFDFLLAFATYVQIALAAIFGLVLALSYRLSTFIPVLIAWFCALPSFIFDRTRSTMLATVLPGFLYWVFLRLRTNLLVKMVILLAGFMVVSTWLKFIIDYRGDVSISYAFALGAPLERKGLEDRKHLGLNMFEELGFINSFITTGTYRPNWGQRYFAEIANPIPRSIWPGKPMIGIDYAIARGQLLDVDSGDGTEVGATISTGMIGQGVVNFGRVLGPLAAASLMAFWASVLARQDLLLIEPGRIFLYGLGLILTFNMGRDITLLVLYPFVFVYLALLGIKGWLYLHKARALLKPNPETNNLASPPGLAARRGRK